MSRLSLKLLRCRRATAAVEFALVVPVLVCLLFGIFAVGAYCATINGLEQLAAGAARQTIAGTSDTERTSLASTYLDGNTSKYPYLQQSALSSKVVNDSTSRTTTIVVSYDTTKNSAFAIASRIVPILPSTIMRIAVVPQGGY